MLLKLLSLLSAPISNKHPDRHSRKINQGFDMYNCERMSSNVSSGKPTTYGMPINDPAMMVNLRHSCFLM